MSTKKIYLQKLATLLLAMLTYLEAYLMIYFFIHFPFLGILFMIKMLKSSINVGNRIISGY